MSDDFQAHYTSELLDDDTRPSIRLLSMMHQFTKPGTKVRWIPWQLRLFAREYSDVMEDRSSKATSTETQLIASAFFDDTPELQVDHLRLTPASAFRSRSQCPGNVRPCPSEECQSLRQDKMVLCSMNLEHDASLRPASMKEVIAADRKMSGTISDLVEKGWSLDDALFS